MITENDIKEYINKIPPAPKVLKETILHVNNGELAKAANTAVEDPALSAYLKTVVNKPIFGFANEVSDTKQIFSILGLNSAKQILYNYMVSLISPDKWSLFKLNQNLFYDLQADLSANWKKILTHLKVDDATIESSISLLSASIIIADALFAHKLDEVHLLRASNDLNYNEILQRMTQKNLFNICEMIALQWEMKPEITTIIYLASGQESYIDESSQYIIYGKWMHLLLFYTLSSSKYLEADLNDFIEFNPEYVENITEEFMSFMEIS